MYPIFCMLFSHFHKSTMVPGKALSIACWTDWIIIQNEIKWHKKLWSIWSDIALTKSGPNPTSMSPWFSKVVSKIKHYSLSLQGIKKEIPKLNHFLWVPRRDWNLPRSAFFILCPHDKTFTVSGGNVPSFFLSITETNFWYFCPATIFFPCIFDAVFVYLNGTSQFWLMCDIHVVLLCYQCRLAAHKQ